MIKFILGDNTPVNVDSFKVLVAAIYLSVIGPEVFIVQPGFVQGLVQYAGFSETTAGDIASAEMWGIAITTVFMTFFASRFNWRNVCAASLLVIALGNFASVFAESPLAFGLCRMVAGIGAGGIISLGFAIVGLTSNTDRNFGWLIMWVLIYGAIVLLAMPTAYRLVGLDGVIVFFALFALSGLAFVRWLPHSGTEHPQTDVNARDIPPAFKGMALAAMFCYFLAQGVVWAYLFLIGLAGGGSEQAIANGLTVSQFTGVAGAFTAAVLGSRFGRAWPLTFSILATLLPLAFLFGSTTALAYGIAVCIYNYGWNVTHPFLLAAMASFDRTGRVVVYAVAMQMLGLANGPWIAARVISPGDYGNVLWLGMLLFAAALVFIMPPVLKKKMAG